MKATEPDDEMSLGHAKLYYLNPAGARALSLILALIGFAADLAIPRGATAAIGYCLVPVIAVATQSPAFLVGITAVCLSFTWIACLLEPVGAPLWISLFDRASVSAILILVLFLVLRRAAIINALLRQTGALNEAKQELERSNAELGNFASVVAHDLRGPLNTIGMLLPLVSRDNIEAAPENNARIVDARAEVKRMSGMIENLLQYGRIGSKEVRLANCDCQVVLNEVKKSLRASIVGAGVQITHGPLPTVRSDPSLIARLFQNLIENGIKYRSAAVPTIHISANEIGDFWQFSVQDNGIGIAPEDAERIFEPFHQVTGGSRGGVGLGLATCKRIVAKHGGQIAMKSNPGQGSVFMFTIPRTKDGPQERAANAANES